MMEIVGYLTQMRFGDQDQSKAKDNKEVCVCVVTVFIDLQACCWSNLCRSLISDVLFVCLCACSRSLQEESTQDWKPSLRAPLRPDRVQRRCPGTSSATHAHICSCS